MPHDGPQRDDPKGRADVAAVLLILQTGLTTVSLVTTVYFSAGHRWVGLLTLALGSACIAVAGGLAHMRPWAQRSAILIQGLFVVNGLTPSLLPHPGMGVNLIALITNIVMPLAIILLVRPKKVGAYGTRNCLKR